MYVATTTAATLGILLVVGLLSSHWLPLNNSDSFDSSQNEITLLVIFAALTITALVAGIALAVVSHQMPGRPTSLTNTVERSESGTPITSQMHSRSIKLHPAGNHEGKQLLRLSRSTERLASVEQDLIRRISENYDIDRRTYRLMTEIQICTNRILGQLQEIESMEYAVSEGSSDVKFDDVSIG